MRLSEDIMFFNFSNYMVIMGVWTPFSFLFFAVMTWAILLEANMREF